MGNGEREGIARGVPAHETSLADKWFLNSATLGVTLGGGLNSDPMAL